MPKRRFSSVRWSHMVYGDLELKVIAVSHLVNWSLDTKGLRLVSKNWAHEANDVR
jgi:hypothetical protein